MRATATRDNQRLFAGLPEVFSAALGRAPEIL